MCRHVLNGRSDQGNGYTSVSPKGLAVVDYCLVPIDSLTQVTNFKVLDILDVAEKFHTDIPTKISDHSLYRILLLKLLWILIFIHMPTLASTFTKYLITS